MTGSRASDMLQCNLSCNVLIFPCEIKGMITCVAHCCDSSYSIDGQMWSENVSLCFFIMMMAI